MRVRALVPCPEARRRSENFVFTLHAKKSTYCFIGNGDTPMVHHPWFVFEQGILPKGAAYWVALTEGYLR